MPRNSQISGRLLAAFLAALCLAAVSGVPATASRERTGTGSICEASSRVAARRTGVPADVLRAISLTETGRRRSGRLEPWPWTVNMQGKGRWFATRAAALAFTKQKFAAGARSFDVGCFQINYRWHGGAFASIDAMFDPDANAAYAARFLNRLFAETGSWSSAAGAYHSRTKDLASRYRGRFDRILARLGEGARAPAKKPAPAAGKRQPASILTGALLASESPDTGRAPTAAPGSLVILASQADGWQILTPARGALY